MKYLLVLFITILTLSTSIAQGEKNWFTSKVAAVEYSKNNDTKILMVFAGSDWCKPCIQFKKDILISEEFKAFSMDSLSILYLDFPSKKKNKLSKKTTTHNEQLAEEFNQSGTFPKIILLDHDLLKIKEISFKNQSPSEFLLAIKE